MRARESGRAGGALGERRVGVAGGIGESLARLGVWVAVVGGIGAGCTFPRLPSGAGERPELADSAGEGGDGEADSESGGGGESGGGEEAGPPDCADAPVVTWESFGEGFLIENCQSCHASTAPERHGAPSGVAFDDLAAVAAAREDLLRVATGTSPSMPPMGGVTDDQRRLFEVWLRCEAW